MQLEPCKGFPLAPAFGRATNLLTDVHASVQKQTHSTAVDGPALPAALVTKRQQATIFPVGPRTPPSVDGPSGTAGGTEKKKAS